VVGEKVGAHLTPDSVALPGLRFTVAFMLSYKGSPLGAIAYVDSAGGGRLCFASSPTRRRTLQSVLNGGASCRLRRGHGAVVDIW
jgi:hypothetical protein